MSTLRVSNIEAKADPSSPSVDEKLKVTNSNGDILVHIDGKTAGVTTIGINTTDRSFTVDAEQNVEFLGIVTATKFSLSGGGEITGGDGNFTGIVTSGSGNFTGGLSVGTAVTAAAVTAATANFTSSLTAASANFSGNVSIAGTLTYEDVTNVDSIGIATARTGIDVTGGHIDLADNSKVRVGTGDDLQVYHDGTDTWIDNDEGDLYIRNTGDDIIIRAADDVLIQTQASEGAVIARGDGQVELYHNNSKKLETTTTGVEVSGTTKTDTLEVTQEYPSIRPTLDLNFAATKTLDRRITFTRDGLGTYTDDMGIIKYASSNTPRFDHDPVTGESLGLLIEESRTNLLTYSDLVSGEGLGTGWAIGGNRASKGSNATAPDGTLSAWNSVYNGTSGDASLYKVGGEITTSNSTVYTLSIFAKVPSTNTHVVGVRIRTYNNNHSATFNLLTGTIVGTAEGTTTNRIEAYPNGWYRCSITFTSGTDGNQGVQFYMSNPSNNTLLNDSNANGEEIYYWGAQMEEGDFATSYIPTSGTTVTRKPDHAYIRDVRVFDFFNETEGTVLFEHTDVPQTTVARYPGIGFSRTNTVTSTRAIHVFFSTSNQDVYYLVRGPGSYPASDVVTMGASSGFELAGRIAFVYKANDFVLARNGTIVGTDTSGALPDDCFGLALGSNGFSDYQFLNAHIKSFKYYNKRLPNAQLQGLTQQ